MSETKLATKADLKEMYDRILPYLGGMPEMLANKFSKGDLYSTDEKMIGQWVDGKPLYQKTVAFDVSTYEDANERRTFILGTISDVDSFVDLVVRYLPSTFATVKHTIGSTMSRGAQSQHTNYANCYTSNEIRVMHQCLVSDNVSRVKGYFTVKYTKTTDSAIAIGSDTDYSTNEKIVGTWIDGKPLYQRTFVTTNSYSTNSSVNFLMTLDEISIANLDSLVSCHVLLQTKIATIPPFRYAYDTSESKLKLNFSYVEAGISGGFAILAGSYVTIQYTKTT